MILSKELEILKALSFNIGKPIALNFLRRNSKAGYVGVRHHTLAKYILEESLTNYPLASVKPSEKAAAALLISLKILDPSLSLQVKIYSYDSVRQTCFYKYIRLFCRICGLPT